MDDKDIPNIKISEEGLAKLREELSSEEMRIGLARIQELLLSMRATQHDKEEAKKMLGVTDEELDKIDDDIDMDHGALYLKIELMLRDEFAMTDTKNLNRVIRQDVARTIASLDLSTIDRLAEKCIKVHDQNLEKFREDYYDSVGKKEVKPQPQTEPEK